MLLVVVEAELLCLARPFSVRTLRISKKLPPSCHVQNMQGPLCACDDLVVGPASDNP